jgi:hypothetical protein
LIEIPEALGREGESHNWVTSNPVGYIRWFEDQCAKSLPFRMLLEKARQEPLPALVLTSQKPILSRAVQLFKRHRDVVFRGDGNAPSSIILTTFAATLYQGQSSVEQTLADVLDQMKRDPGIGGLQNPSTGEKLCEKWTDNQRRKFATFATNFCDDLESLRALRGVHNIGTKLKELFGEETPTGPDIISKAITEYMREFTEARHKGDLRYTRAGLTTVGGSAISQHRFYGRKPDE